MLISWKIEGRRMNREQKNKWSDMAIKEAAEEEIEEEEAAEEREVDEDEDEETEDVEEEEVEEMNTSRRRHRRPRGHRLLIKAADLLALKTVKRSWLQY